MNRSRWWWLASRVIASGIVTLALSAPASLAEPLKYLGPHPGDPARGIVEQDGVLFDVTPGSDVPGWGTVYEVSDTTLVIDYYLTEHDKDMLRARGAEVYDIGRVRVPRSDLRQR